MYREISDQVKAIMERFFARQFVLLGLDEEQRSETLSKRGQKHRSTAFRVFDDISLPEALDHGRSDFQHPWMDQDIYRIVNLLNFNINPSGGLAKHDIQAVWIIPAPMKAARAIVNQSIPRHPIVFVNEAELFIAEILLDSLATDVVPWITEVSDIVDFQRSDSVATDEQEQHRRTVQDLRSLFAHKDLVALSLQTRTPLARHLCLMLDIVARKMSPDYWSFDWLSTSISYGSQNGESTEMVSSEFARDYLLSYLLDCVSHEFGHLVNNHLIGESYAKDVRSYFGLTGSRRLSLELEADLAISTMQHRKANVFDAKSVAAGFGLFDSSSGSLLREDLSFYIQSGGAEVAAKEILDLLLLLDFASSYEKVLGDYPSPYERLIIRSTAITLMTKSLRGNQDYNALLIHVMMSWMIVNNLLSHIITQTDASDELRNMQQADYPLLGVSTCFRRLGALEKLASKDRKEFDRLLASPWEAIVPALNSSLIDVDVDPQVTQRILDAIRPHVG